MANLDYWYDAQLRRYLLQFMRIFSGFKVSEGLRDGVTHYNKVPVRYADMQRMVAHILTKGSENLVNSTPFISASIFLNSGGGVGFGGGVDVWELFLILVLVLISVTNLLNL